MDLIKTLYIFHFQILLFFLHKELITFRTFIDMKAYSLFITILLGLMPYAVEAQETDVNSRDIRGKVVYQDDEVVFRQLDEHTWIGNGHRALSRVDMTESRFQSQAHVLSCRIPT